MLKKKFCYKRASPSSISHLCGREMQIKTSFSRGKLLTLKNMPQNFIISPQQYKISDSYLFNKGYSENEANCIGKSQRKRHMYVVCQLPTLWWLIDN